MLNSGDIVWKQVNKDGKPVWQVYQKHYMGDGRESSDLWVNIDGNKKATRELNSIFDGIKLFDHPKPIMLMRQIVQLATSGSCTEIILDFFAGSSSLAAATLEQNAKDGGDRKFIMVQIPELCDEKSEAFKAGYKTIAEISKERIRRAGKKIKQDSPLTTQNLDIGFRVLKVDSSNMSDVYYTPDAIEQDQLKILTDNIKPDRTPEDLLFQVLLDWGVDLSLPIRRETIQSKTVFFVNEPPYDLVACFDTGVNEDLVKELAQFEPLRVVFRDTGFVSDAVKINVEQIFKQMSPGTEVKSI
jgi:adenine-specific DNA-methyltransferase